MTTEVVTKRFFSAERRRELASSGKAMSDGSFPIENEQDLRNALRLVGKAKNPAAARAHIARRAKALGCPELVTKHGDPDEDGPLYPHRKQGNSGDRAKRSKFLLIAFGNGQTCPCIHCGSKLTFDTLTQERIIPETQGGRYVHENLTPACLECNESRGDSNTRKIAQTGVNAKQSFDRAVKKGLLVKKGRVYVPANLDEATVLMRYWNKETKHLYGLEATETAERAYLNEKGITMYRQGEHLGGGRYTRNSEVLGAGVVIRGGKGKRKVVAKAGIPPEFSLVCAALKYRVMGFYKDVVGVLTYRNGPTGTFYTVMAYDADKVPTEVVVQPDSITDLGAQEDMAEPDVLEKIAKLSHEDRALVIKYVMGDEISKYSPDQLRIAMGKPGGGRFAAGNSKRKYSADVGEKGVVDRKELSDKNRKKVKDMVDRLAGGEGNRQDLTRSQKRRVKRAVNTYVARQGRRRSGSEPVQGNIPRSGVRKDEDYEDFEIEVPISKVDTDKQIAFGWAQVAVKKDGELVVDKQGDFIDDISHLENAAYEFVMESRDGGEMHIRKGVSTLVESMMFTPEKIEKMGLPEGALPVGWWVGYKFSDPEVWADVKSGKYAMFSVHGLGRREYVEDGA